MSLVQKKIILLGEAGMGKIVKVQEVHFLPHNLHAISQFSLNDRLRVIDLQTCYRFLFKSHENVGCFEPSTAQVEIVQGVPVRLKNIHLLNPRHTDNRFLCRLKEWTLGHQVFNPVQVFRNHHADSPVTFSLDHGDDGTMLQDQLLDPDTLIDLCGFYNQGEQTFGASLPAGNVQYGALCLRRNQPRSTAPYLVLHEMLLVKVELQHGGEAYLSPHNLVQLV